MGLKTPARQQVVIQTEEVYLAVEPDGAVTLIEWAPTPIVLDIEEEQKQTEDDPRPDGV
jgi:hypothetical protein